MEHLVLLIKGPIPLSNVVNLDSHDHKQKVRLQYGHHNDRNSGKIAYKAFLDNRGKGIGLRLGVKTTGCSGMAYVLEFVDELNEEDQVFEQYGCKDHNRCQKA